MQIESEFAQHLGDRSDLKFVKLHFLNQISDHIRQLSHLLHASYAIPESAMMDLEQADRQLNHHEVTIIMLTTQNSEEAFEHQELNANAAKQYCSNDMPTTKAPVMRMMEILRPAIKTLHHLADWYAMPKRAPENHFACCFESFADITDYADHTQCFCLPNDAKYIWYIALAILATVLNYDELAVRLVHCSGSTRWRNHMLPRNESVLLWMGNSPVSNGELTAGRSPSR
jgi:hypothetical protein